MKPGNKNSYKSLTSININEKEYNYFSLNIAETATVFPKNVQTDAQRNPV